MSKRYGIWMALGVSITLLSCGITAAAHAVTLQSDNYQFAESTLGAGGVVRSESDNYRASSAPGSLAVGRSVSDNYQVEAGPETSADPSLSFAVNNIDANFGQFTSAASSVTTATFSVTNYTSYGYVVQIVGEPPTNGAHTIDPMHETSVSQPGTEQFGINLVANTLPEPFGAAPDNGEFGVGQASSLYDTPNQYRYVSGETIAMAPKSSGETKYTISYLVNVDNLTPGGHYTSEQTVIVTGTY